MEISKEYQALLDKYRVSSGEVQGRLHLAAGDDGAKYKVVHHITGQDIACVIPDYLEKPAAALQRRVALSGIVHRNQDW